AHELARAERGARGAEARVDERTREHDSRAQRRDQARGSLTRGVHHGPVSQTRTALSAVPAACSHDAAPAPRTGKILSPAKHFPTPGVFSGRGHDFHETSLRHRATPAARTRANVARPPGKLAGTPRPMARTRHLGGGPQGCA